MYEVYGPAYAFVDGKLVDLLNTGLENVVNAVRGPLLLALTLYIVLYGYAIFRGSISEPIMDGVVRLVKLCFIYTVATTVAYNDYVTEPLFRELPNWLARAISGGSVGSVGESFDQFLYRGIILGQKIFGIANFTDPGPYLTGILVIAVTAIATALGFGIVMIAKVALALLVALGPIFIACLVFDASRQFFYGWLKQGVNYLILFALIITVFQLILALVKEQWGTINGQADPEMGGFLFIALCILGALFFLQTPNIAAGIAGGAAAGIGDFFNAGGAGAAGAAAAALGAGKLGYRGARAVASRFGGSEGGSVRPSGGGNGHPRR